MKNLPVTLTQQRPDSYSAFHLYVIRLQLDRISKTHRQVFEELRLANIGVNLHYIPVHTHPHYQAMGFKLGDFLEAERYYSEAISLPLFHALSEVQQDKVVDVLGKVLTT